MTMYGYKGAFSTHEKASDFLSEYCKKMPYDKFFEGSISIMELTIDTGITPENSTTSYYNFPEHHIYKRSEDGLSY